MNSKFDPSYAILARKLYSEGLTDEQVARVLDVNRDTIFAWVDSYPEFAEARANAKQDADEQVKAALFKRAVGYTVTKQKVCSYEGSSWTENYEDPIPGDVTAQIFWLCNRDKANWQQRQTAALELVKPIQLAYSLPPKRDHVSVVETAIDVTPNERVA